MAKFTVTYDFTEKTRNIIIKVENTRGDAMSIPFVKKKTIPIAEMESYMRRWEQRANGFVKVIEIGKYPKWPIYAAVFSNPEIPDDEKYNALILASHSGVELSGCTTVLSVGNFLATLNERAMNILSKNKIILVPCPLPDVYEKAAIQDGEQYDNPQAINVAYRNHACCDDATCMFDEEKDALNNINPVARPYSTALAKLMDELIPEMSIDVHGVWFEDAIMSEYHGQLSASNVNYTNSRRFVDEMQRAAEDEGYAITNEDDYEKIKAFDGGGFSSTDEYGYRFWHFGKHLMIHSYGYLKYHTQHICMESCFERGSMARILRALEIGVREGYPVDSMDCCDYACQIRTIGKTPELRRQSRKELWPQIKYFGRGLMYPVTGGISGVVLTNGMATFSEMFPNRFSRSMPELCDLLEAKGYDMSEMREVLENEKRVFIRSVGSPHNKNKDEKAVTKYGATIRLGIQYSDAVPNGVWLNGKRLNENEDYKIICVRNWTYVDVYLKGQIPDIAFAFCKYDYTPHPMGIVEFD